MFTVALKSIDRVTQLCGEYETREEAEQNAKYLRNQWAAAPLRIQKPTSIRVREIKN